MALETPSKVFGNVNDIPIDIDKLIARDQEVFARMVEGYQSMVFTICLKVTRSQELAEEAAQDTFVKVYRKIRTFERKSSFKTWLYRIAYHTAIDYHRKKRLEVLSLDDDQGAKGRKDQSASQLATLVRDEEKEGLHRCIDKLPEEQAFIINLFYLEERNIKEICLITGLTKSNVKIKLFRARKSLKTIIEENTDLNL